VVTNELHSHSSLLKRSGPIGSVWLRVPSGTLTTGLYIVQGVGPAWSIAGQTPITLTPAGSPPWSSRLTGKIRSTPARSTSSGEPNWLKPQSPISCPLPNKAQAGNLLCDAPGYAYQYDAEGKIKSGAGVNCIYDPEGNRVEKSGSTAVDTVYFAGRPITVHLLLLARGKWECA
jgi:hypothetical protein